MLIFQFAFKTVHELLYMLIKHNEKTIDLSMLMLNIYSKTLMKRLTLQQLIFLQELKSRMTN